MICFKGVPNFTLTYEFLGKSPFMESEAPITPREALVAMAVSRAWLQH